MGTRSALILGFRCSSSRRSSFRTSCKIPSAFLDASNAVHVPGSIKCFRHTRATEWPSGLGRRGVDATGSLIFDRLACAGEICYAVSEKLAAISYKSFLQCSLHLHRIYVAFLPGSFLHCCCPWVAKICPDVKGFFASVLAVNHSLI